MASSSTRALVLPLLLLSLAGSSTAQLNTNFYSKSCPTLDSIVRTQVQSAINRESRLGASVLRLFFHDCFVNGCDASLLLDDTPTFTGEKRARPNLNSARGFEVIDAIKTAVERACPRVVSCADILAIAARDSVVILKGPTWQVKLGRRDARTASQGAAASSIPPPTANLTRLITFFSNVGLSVKDMVALAGAHTLGLARCTSFRARIYNETNIDAAFARLRRGRCPRAAPAGDNNTAPLDRETPTVFDNSYFANLVGNRGLLHSDQQFFSGGSTDGTVRSYSRNAAAFTKDFVAGMINMGDIKPLTGSNGEIRRNCRFRN